MYLNKAIKGAISWLDLHSAASLLHFGPLLRCYANLGKDYAAGYDFR
ncbi:hypothetical protein Misp06_03365 [Microbulbifer sp. NBRC 101763]